MERLIVFFRTFSATALEIACFFAFLAVGAGAIFGILWCFQWMFERYGEWAIPILLVGMILIVAIGRGIYEAARA